MLNFLQNLDFENDTLLPEVKRKPKTIKAKGMDNCFGFDVRFYNKFFLIIFINQFYYIYLFPHSGLGRWRRGR